MYACLIAVSVPTGLAALGIAALALLSTVLLVGIFGPMPRYKIACPDQLASNDSQEFLNLLEALVDAKANRTGSFEVLAVREAALALRMERDMETDLQESRQVSLEEWKRRPVTERAPELLGWIFARQQ